MQGFSTYIWLCPPLSALFTVVERVWMVIVNFVSKWYVQFKHLYNMF